MPIEVYKDMETKTCYRCEQIKSLTEFYKDKKKKYGVRAECKVCCVEIGNEWYRKNKEYVDNKYTQYRKDRPNWINNLNRIKKEKGLCTRCGELLDRKGQYCIICKEKQNIEGKQHSKKLKEEVFNYYGHKCMCKGCDISFSEFLSIDHINGDGANHRDKSGRRLGGSHLYRWLIKYNFPPGFQLLCMNCNFAKGHFGECPHRRASLASC